MRDFNNKKNLPYQNLKLKKNKTTNLINSFQKKNQNLNQINLGYKTDKQEMFKKINTNNIQRNIIDEYENELINKEKERNNPHPSKEFYHKKNYYSKDLTENNYVTNYNNNNNNNNNSYFNLTNISSEHKNYKKYRTKYSIYNTSFKNDIASHDYSLNDYKKKYNSDIKNHNRNYSNTSYDFKKIKYNLPNNKEKKIPVIVVSKKPKNSYTSNIIRKRKKIIKIQSAWRGYFLRKIAVGSIKKYIGFIALIKYLEKVFSNNIEYLFYEFLFLLKKIY